MKWQVKQILFRGGEGRTGQLLKNKTFPDWASCNDFLLSISHYAPAKGEGYDKIYYDVEFETGFVYSGRFDFQYGVTQLNLYVRDSLLFMSGRQKPEWLEQEKYDAFLAGFKPDVLRHMNDTLDNYDWGNEYE